jgi:hypothetical protein
MCRSVAGAGFVGSVGIEIYRDTDFPGFVGVRFGAPEFALKLILRNLSAAKSALDLILQNP